MSVLKLQRTMVLAGIAITAFATSACNEKGLPGKNRELSDVARREWRYPLYETTPSESKVIEIAGRSWQVTGASENIPANLLTPVGGTADAQIFSLKSDPAPYDRLYAAGENGRLNVVTSIN
jgi:hypothetical protein